MTSPKADPEEFRVIFNAKLKDRSPYRLVNRHEDEIVIANEFLE